MSTLKLFDKNYFLCYTKSIKNNSQGDYNMIGKNPALEVKTIKKILHQLQNAEYSIRDIPLELQEAIEINEDIDCLFLADTLAKLNSIIKYLSDDANYYGSKEVAQDNFPGKAIYIDKWNHKWVPQCNE